MSGNNNDPMNLSQPQIDAYEALNKADVEQQHEQQAISTWNSIVNPGNQNTGTDVGQLGAQQGDQTGSAAGHYEMSLPEMKRERAEYAEFIARIKRLEPHFDTVIGVTPPGPDPVSKLHAKKLSAWATTQKGYWQSRVDYIQHLHDAMDKTIKEYEEQEARVTDDMNRHTRGLDA